MSPPSPQLSNSSEDDSSEDDRYKERRPLKELPSKWLFSETKEITHTNGSKYTIDVDRNGYMKNVFDRKDLQKRKKTRERRWAKEKKERKKRRSADKPIALQPQQPITTKSKELDSEDENEDLYDVQTKRARMNKAKEKKRAHKKVSSNTNSYHNPNSDLNSNPHINPNLNLNLNLARSLQLTVT
jgi:hypothetical protein